MEHLPDKNKEEFKNMLGYNKYSLAELYGILAGMVLFYSFVGWFVIVMKNRN